MSELHLRGSIRTGDPARPRADSVTLLRGRIVALDAEPAAGALVLTLPADRWIVPGLIDAHLHPILGGLALGQLDLAGVASREAFEAEIARAHAALPPGAWLLAGGWSETRWGGAAPDATWLRAAGERPCLCRRADLHAGLVNPAVLARIDASRDPEGGRFVRDPASGAPTGLVLESALWSLVAPLVPPPTVAERGAALDRALAHAASRGLVALGAMEYLEDLEGVYDARRAAMPLRIRATALDRATDEDVDRAAAFARRNDDRLAVIGCKSFADGTLGSRTARMLEDYADDPGRRGLWLDHAAAETLGAWARRVAESGLQPAVHAIGDAAARRVLDAYDDLPPSLAAAVRPRIEHAQQVDPADQPRFAGRIASMQPLHREDDALVVVARLGPERLEGFFPFEGLAAAGATLAFGSDWPVVSLDPIAGMRAAISARDGAGRPFRPAGALGAEAVLGAYTAGAARTLHLDDSGVIAPGRRADLTILDGDPLAFARHAGEPDAGPTRATATIVGGSFVHDAEGIAPVAWP